MTIWQMVTAVALFAASTYGMIRLVQHWSLADARARNAEAWSYLGWTTEELHALQRKYLDLISTGKAKPKYLRSLDAISQAISVQGKFAKSRTYSRSYTYIDIRPNGRAYDVFYVVDDSELASGREQHIGRIQPFMSKRWVLRPSNESSLSWSLDESALAELLDKVTELNAGT